MISSADPSYSHSKEDSQISQSRALDVFVYEMSTLYLKLKSLNLAELPSNRQRLITVVSQIEGVQSRSIFFRKSIKKFQRVKRDQSIPTAEIDDFEYRDYRTQRLSQPDIVAQRVHENRLRIQKVLSLLVRRSEQILNSTDLVTARDLSLTISDECSDAISRLEDLDSQI